MKRDSLMAAMACATATCAMAQAPAPSGVTLYGLIDTGVEHVTNVGPSRTGLTRMPTLTGSLPSRWGMRGSEDLGNGLRAVFTLEQGFAPDSGVLGQGRTFGRQAFVGLAGSWGSITLGRQYTMLFWSLLDAEVMGPNVYGPGSLDSYIPNARADNAIAYRGTFNGLTLGATYSLGRDAVNLGPGPAGTNCAGENAADKKACRAWSVLAKYDAASWGAALAVDRLRGGPGAFAGLTASHLGDSRVSANGYVKLGATKLGGGVVRRNNDASPTPESDLWYVGVTHPVTPQFIVDAQLARLNIKDSANQATLLALRGSYLLSKRTLVYATAGRLANDGTLALSVSAGAPGSNPVAGDSQTGVMLGIRHVF